jgi:TolB-like protein/Tfp pilus assembly protein PilF
VVGKDELLQALWPGVVVTEESLTRCVSDIRHALGDEGQQIIKTLPRRGYMVAAPVSTADGTAAPPRPAAKGLPRAGLLAAALALAVLLAWVAVAQRPGPSPGAPPRLSIVVLPLAVRGGADRAQEDLAAVLTDEITSDLSRIPESFVIGRGSAASYAGRAVDPRQVGRDLGVRYVLEGGLSRRGDEVRLTLQLLEAESGRVLGSEALDGRMADLPALQREVTGAVARSLQMRVVQAEADRAARLRPVDLAAQVLVLQVWASWNRGYSAESLAAAREKMQRAVALDPDSASAWAWLALTYVADIGRRYTPLRGATREQWLKLAAEASGRAYALDPNDPRVLRVRAWVLSYLHRSEDAVELLQRAIAINRNDADAWGWLSYTYTTLGRNRDAIAAGHEAIRISPRDSRFTGFLVVIAAAYLHDGDDRQALEWARRSANAKPDFAVPHSWIAAAAANLGEMEAAHAAIAEFRRLLPQYTIASFRDESLCSNAPCERQRERYYAGLKKAGLPE